MSKNKAKYSVADLHLNEVLGYARVSTEEPDSIPKQIGDICAYARENGFAEPRMFTDYAISGRSADREGFNAMRAEVPKFPGCRIITWKYTRIGRVTWLSKAFAELREQYLCEFHATDVGLMPWFMENVQGLMAEYDGRSIAESTRDGRMRAMLRNEYIPAAPFGYYKDERKNLQIDPETGPVVAELFRRRAAGETLNSLAEWLNGLGYTPVHAARWTHGRVGNLIRRPIYKGEFVNQPIIMPWEQREALLRKSGLQ